MQFRLVSLLAQILITEKMFLFLPVFLLGLGHFILCASYGIFSGLHLEFFTQIKSRIPHLIVQPKGSWFTNSPRDWLSQQSGVRAVRETLLSQGILIDDSRTTGVMIQGINTEERLSLQTLYPQTSCEVTVPALTIFLSKTLASQRDPKSCEISLVLLDGSELILKIAGTFPDFGLAQKQYLALLPLDTLASQLGLDSKPNRLEVFFDDPYAASNLLQVLLSTSDFQDIEGFTWLHSYAETLRWFEIEKGIHGVILVFAVVFICVSLYASAFLVCLKKSPSLQSLQALGTCREELRFAILKIYSALMITALVWSTFFLYCTQKLLEWFSIPLPQSLFYSASLPMHISSAFVIFAAFCTFIPSLFSLRRVANLIVSATLLCLPLHANGFSQINPQAHFRPDLDYRARETTGFVALVLEDQVSRKLLNNPLLSRLGFRFGSAVALSAFNFQANGQMATTDIDGRWQCLPCRQRSLRLDIWPAEPPLEFVTAKGKTRLILVWLSNTDDARLPTRWLAETELKVIANPEFRALHQHLMTIREHLNELLSPPFLPGRFIDNDYRDDKGERDDFIAYLKLLWHDQNKVQIKNPHLRVSDSELRLQLTLESTSTHVVELHLNSDYQVKRYFHLKETASSSSPDTTSTTPTSRSGKRPSRSEKSRDVN